MLKTSLILMLLAFLANCTAIKKYKVLETEHKLSASGFKVEYANTPKKLIDLKKMEQHQFIPIQKDGNFFYIFSDSEFCKCSYRGSEEAYLNYLDLVSEESSEEMYESEDNGMFNQGWGVYGRGC